MRFERLGVWTRAVECTIGFHKPIAVGQGGVEGSLGDEDRNSCGRNAGGTDSRFSGYEIWCEVCKSVDMYKNGEKKR
jgi:hypothetical protein